jgi:hypothetical protein
LFGPFDGVVDRLVETVRARPDERYFLEDYRIRELRRRGTKVSTARARGIVEAPSGRQADRFSKSSSM